ncbi:MAG: GAF domain-containing protein [Desulfuromonadaceae bacterium]|nr:GAF domain-containing protein [Desulfuromonadaceae bacterium]
MTIKTKLIANVLVTATIVVAISLASYISMRFIQEKFSYLSDISTPLQLRTIELQRELQRCITNLLKVNAARTMNEYAYFRVEAERSLDTVAKTQKKLKAINGNTVDVSDELGSIALETFIAVEDRINSDKTATSTNTIVMQSMKELSFRLNDLDAYVSNLQVGYTRAFEAALENTITFSSRTRSIEELLNRIRELQLVAVTVQNSLNSTAVLIAKGKLKAVVARIAKNDYYKSNPSIAEVTTGVTDKLAEFITLQSNAIAQKNEDAISKAAESGKVVGYTLNDLFQTLDQETLLARDELSLATSNQSNIFAKTSSANDILVLNAHLIALGTRVTSETNRLFTTVSATELNRLDSEIRSLFTDIQVRKQQLNDSLTKLNAFEEKKILLEATASLDGIRTEIFSANGILTALNKRLTAIDQANKSADKLHTLVRKVSAQGDESISDVQRDREKSVVAVNSLIRKSLSQIVGVSFVAIIIGIMFGYWIFRSMHIPLQVVLAAVMKQLQQVNEKAEFAEAVAGGDLSREVIISEAISVDSIQRNKDELRKVLNAVVRMSEAQVALDRAFSLMTESLRRVRSDEARRNHVKSGLYELNKIMRNEHQTAALADEALTFLAEFLGGGVGIIYLYDDIEQTLKTISTYAITKTNGHDDSFRLGEGLPGQVALAKKMICLNSIPLDYLPISSALGDADPLHIVIIPIKYNETLVGVLELGSFRRFNDDDFEFLDEAVEGIAIALNVNRSHQLVNALLEKTREQAEEMRVQREELLRSNEVLEDRARMLSELWKDVEETHHDS